MDILRRLKYALMPKVDSISMATVANGATHQIDIRRIGRSGGAPCAPDQTAHRRAQIGRACPQPRPMPVHG